MSEWVGLYYRHVHFRDEQWLKLAALYWDRVYRFDTDGVEASLPEISRSEILLYGEGFLRIATPRATAMQVAADQLFEALVGVDLSQYLTPTADSFGPLDLDWGLAAWKAPQEFSERLIRLDLAALSRVREERVLMHTTLARTYLMLLGSQVAPEYAALPIADDEFDHAAASVSARRLVSGVLGQPAPEALAGERSALLVSIAVAAVLPRDLRDIPVERIIEFRNRYAGERARFRDAVDAMVTESAHLDGIREQEVLLRHLEMRYETRIRPALNDLARAMRGQRIETAMGAINVQAAAPPVMTSALALIATHPSPSRSAVIGLGGFALGVYAAALQQKRQREHEISASPMAYLHHLETGIDPLNLAERVRAAVRRMTPPRVNR
ncbi:DUF6236 family protein [Streptomyces sp. NPDC056161]|uniref:DUF6236 family protein n=1 Tax=Streptomyces sp. NPDC056161 TaxID=3345732 RepID=UPI0035D67520